ncbi:hypothetical protein PGT21_034027 [Puccinia graminis f. sp. tritici]|uniref:Uncharacterized protein n=1 Tax=Puccinia graminis f. sp. tritici TaxID=56615 RepID=A0A5B0PM39_PUCGR|nr:hypothetical protein PGT21_034027 [Puccinia graminis f. sp. tritici]
MTGSAILDIHDHTRRFIPKNRDVSSPYKHLKVFTDQGSSANIWDLLKKNHQNIVNAPNEWFDFKNMVQLLRNCPVLKYFTIFQLQGPKTHKEAVQILNTQGKAACKLRLLHIRRVQRVTKDNLSFIVSGSHQTLKELTWVYKTSADLVACMVDYTSDNRIRPMYDHNAPLGPVLDRLVRPFGQLKSLQVSGSIFTMDLFDS